MHMFIISLQFFPSVQGFILRYRGTSVYAALAWLLIQPSCKVPTVKRIKNFSLVAINSTFSPNFSHRTFPNKNARQACARARACVRVCLYTHTHIYIYIYVYVMSSTTTARSWSWVHFQRLCSVLTYNMIGVLLRVWYLTFADHN